MMDGCMHARNDHMIVCGEPMVKDNLLLTLKS